MSIAKTLYPDMEDQFFCIGDYDPILKYLGNVALQVDDNDWQGDSRVLYRDGERWGLLIFGWGSCSGCDALQGCTNWGQVDELIKDLQASIKWFDTTANALDYFKTHDWEGDYCWHADETREFVAKGIELLTEATP